VSRKNNKHGGDDGVSEVARIIAGAIGLTVGFVLLWLIIAYSWSAMF